MKHARAQIRAAEQMLRRMGVPVYVPAKGRTDATGHMIPQRVGLGARTLSIASAVSGVSGSIVVPGGGRRHTGAVPRRIGHSETMVLNVWALSAEQRNALFGEEGKSLAGCTTPMVLDGPGESPGGVLTQCGTPNGLDDPRSRADSPVADPCATTDPATLIERFHAELGAPAHEEENADYVELKERLESEEKKEFAVKVRLD